MATVLERVTKLAVDRLGVEEEDVKVESSFTEDLNADSLDLVELIMAFEEEFSQDSDVIEIPAEAAEKITTVAQAVEYLKQKGIQDT